MINLGSTLINFDFLKMFTVHSVSGLARLAQIYITEPSLSWATSVHTGLCSMDHFENNEANQH